MLTAIDGFSGCGGLSLGLQQAGFDVRLAFDLDDNALSTYRANLGDHAHRIDAGNVSGADLLRLARIPMFGLDLYAGGPPCQGFSKQRKRTAGDADERNDLVLEHARLASEMLPSVVLFENVPQLLDRVNERYIERIREVLWMYRLHTQVVDAVNYNTPQRRQRAIIIGVRSDLSGVPLLQPSTTKMTVRDAIIDLPEPDWDGSEHPDFANHTMSRPSTLNLARLRMIPEGGGWSDLPDYMRLRCHNEYQSRSSSGGWRDTYGRMSWNEPAPTLTTGCLSFTKGRFAHPVSDRAITPREAARIQGFPDNFIFNGTRTSIARQIGNAVPVPLARALGVAIRQMLKMDSDRLRSKQHA